MLAKPATQGIKFYRMVMYPVYNVIGLTGVNSICKLQPSCSHFGEKALHEHGFCKAVFMTSAQIYRCGRAQSGDNPVPAAPYSLTQEEKVEAAKTLSLVAAISVACFWGMRKMFR